MNILFFPDSSWESLLVILFFFSHATFKILGEEKNIFFVTSHWDTLQRNSIDEKCKCIEFRVSARKFI